MYDTKLYKPWQYQLLNLKILLSDELYRSKHVGTYLNGVRYQHMYSDDICLCVIIEVCCNTVNQLTLGKYACK